METYYDILEIEESATPEEIKQAYRLLLEVWHPDRFHHKPKLLAKAEQKSGTINKAFETLGTPELKQQYDAWLHANRNWGVQAVGAVTCPSCQTAFFSNPERNEKREFHPDRRRERKDPKRASGAIFDGNEFFTPVRMGMLAIGLLFAGIIVFTVTKSSKVIVSYKPARPVETETLPDQFWGRVLQSCMGLFSSVASWLPAAVLPLPSFLLTPSIEKVPSSCWPSASPSGDPCFTHGSSKLGRLT